MATHGQSKSVQQLERGQVPLFAKEHTPHWSQTVVGTPAQVEGRDIEYIRDPVPSAPYPTVLGYPIVEDAGSEALARSVECLRLVSQPDAGVRSIRDRVFNRRQRVEDAPQFQEVMGVTHGGKFELVSVMSHIVPQTTLGSSHVRVIMELAALKGDPKALQARLATVDLKALSGRDLANLLKILKNSELPTLDLRGCDLSLITRESIPLSVEVLHLSQVSKGQLRLFLNGCERLRELCIEDNSAITSFSGDLQNAHLSNLKLIRCRNLKEVSTLNKFPSLVNLEIVESGVKSFSDLGLCPSLESIHLQNLYRLSLFPKTAKCPSLKSISCDDVNLSKGPDLSSNASLERVSFVNCHRMVKAPKVDHCHQLNYGAFIRCPKLSSLPNISQLPHISTWHVSECKKLSRQDLPPAYM